MGITNNNVSSLNQIIGTIKAFSETKEAHKSAEAEVKRLNKDLGLTPKTVDRQTVEHRKSMVLTLQDLVRKLETSISTMSQSEHKVPRQLTLELETMKSALRRLEGQSSKTPSLQAAMATKGVGMFQSHSMPSDENNPEQPAPSTTHAT